MGTDRSGTESADSSQRDDGPTRPLIVTSDLALLDELLPLAQAGCGDVDVAADPVAARRYWRSASLVVVGADTAAGCVRARLPHRRDIVLVMPGPAEPDDDTDESWRSASALGADHVVVLPAAAPWLTARFGTAGSRHSEEAPVIGVIGGRGGAGSSVLAAGLAVTAAQAGRRTMLIDADPLGGGVDLVLGWENSVGARWPQLAEARGNISVSALYTELPRNPVASRGELLMVSWDRGDTLELPVEAMDATLRGGQRGTDLVILDLPRRLDDAAIRAAQLSDLVLLLVPADVRACASASRVAAQIGPHCQALKVVVRGPAPGRLRPEHVGRSLGLEVAGTLRPEPDLPRALEYGESPVRDGKGPLAELCRELLAQVIRPSSDREVA